MKKHVLICVGVFAFVLQSAHAQNTVIYGTYDDWNDPNWSGNGGYTVGANSAFNYGNITVNGIGNTTAAGGTSIAGSLQVSPALPWSPWNGPIINMPAPTLAVLQALDSQLATSSSLVNQSGTMYVYYTRPDHDVAGSYWNGLAVFYNYNNNWGYWFPSSEVDLGPVSTPSGTEEMYEAIIPYTINATSLTYFGWGFDEYSDYQGSNPWYIASVQVVPLPATVIPAPVSSLFITYEDFNEWTSAGGDLIQADNTWSESNNITCGLGNTLTPGGTGTAGSLLLYWSSLEAGWGSIANGPGEQANADFMQAVDPGCNIYSAASVAAYGNILLNFTFPDTTYGGSYFELGIEFSYAANGYNNYAPFWWSGTKDLGFKDDNGDEVYQATIPYTINAGYYYGFTPYIFVNSDYQPENGFHISNISVSASQAPLITGISLNGSQLVIQGTNGLTGYTFNLLSSTDLTQPLNQWTKVSVGTPFNGPNWSVTNTISANQAFYSIQTVAP